MLWLRFLVKCLPTCFLRKKASVHDSVVTHYWIWPWEIGWRIMNNSRYLIYAEVARAEMLVRQGLVPRMIRERWSGLVAEQTISYLKPLRRFQRFQIQSRIVSWDSKWVQIEHAFLRRENPVATVQVRFCFRDREAVVPTARYLPPAEAA